MLVSRLTPLFEVLSTVKSLTVIAEPLIICGTFDFKFRFGLFHVHEDVSKSPYNVIKPAPETVDEFNRESPLTTISPSAVIEQLEV